MEPAIGGYFNSNTVGNVAVVREDVYWLPGTGTTSETDRSSARLIEYTGYSYRYGSESYSEIREFSAQGYAVAIDFDHNYGIIDSSGETIIDFGKYARIYTPSDDGYAVAYTGVEGTHILLDLNRGTETPIAQTHGGGFGSGLTVVYSNGSLHYEKADGSRPFSAEYAYASDFSNGYAGVRTVGEDVYQIINTSGNTVLFIPNGYLPTGNVSKEGIFTVRDSTWRYGYMDVNGKLIASCQYMSAEMFQNGYAVVRNTDYDCGMIDSNGNVVIPFGTYDRLSNASNTGLVWAANGDGDSTDKTILRVLSSEEAERKAIDALVPKDKYAIHVVDDNGGSLSGVTVTCNGTSVPTDNNGLAIFNRPLFASTPTITAIKPGYISWSNEHSNWTFDNDKGYSTIKMYPISASKYKLIECQYSNSSNMSLSTDLLTRTKTISLGNDLFFAGDLDFGKFYLSCKAIDNSAVAQYELWQNSTRIAVSASGNFNLQFDKTGAPFVKGSNCFIRVVPSDGTTSVDTSINLQFAKSPVNRDTQLSLTSGAISFKIGDDVPFLGGQTFSFNLPIKSKVTAFSNNDKIQFGFNVNLVGGKSEEEQLEAVKKTIGEKVTTYTLRFKHGMSHATVQRLQADMPVSTHTLNKLCTILNCRLEDVAEYVPDE